MTWYLAYLGCFVLGLCFLAFSFLAGQVFGGEAGHDGGDAGHAHDMADGVEGVALPLFSPTVLAVFVGMFGAGGLVLHKGIGIEAPLLHAGGATAISLSSGFAVAWALMKLMRFAESNSMGSHSALSGRTVEVTLSIRGAEFGEIAYESGGSRQTMIAKSATGATFQQGDAVQIVRVVEGTAYVGPPGSVAPLQVVTSIPTGTPVETVPQQRIRK